MPEKSVQSKFLFKEEHLRKRKNSKQKKFTKKCWRRRKKPITISTKTRFFFLSFYFLRLWSLPSSLQYTPYENPWGTLSVSGEQEQEQDKTSPI